MKIKEVFDFVDAMRPNGFMAAEKTIWLNEVEGKIQTEVMLLSPADVRKYVYSATYTTTGISFPDGATMVCPTPTGLRPYGTMTITGLTTYSANNITATIRSVSSDGTTLYFDNNTFSAIGETGDIGESTLNYDGSGVELAVSAPHDKLYYTYVQAMVDFYNGEYDRYSNAITLWNSFYDEYRKWYSHHINPGTGNAYSKGYYISAYGIAVKHGYVGTEEEWLLSLKGDQAASTQEAIAAASAAASSEVAAAGSATTASNSAALATTKAGESSASAQSASASATASANSATASANSASTAAAKATLAGDSATSAAASAVTAQNAAAATTSDSAATAADRAATAANATMTEGYKTAALSARDDAVTAKTAAETARDAAADSATAASGSKTDAANSATNAATSAQNAASSADAAATAKDDAIAATATKADKVTTTNIVTNGDFSDGTAGWDAAGGVLSVDKEALSIIGSGSSGYPYITQLLDLIVGHKYYVRQKVRVTNDACMSIQLRFDDGGIYKSFATPVANTWYDYSTVITVTSTSGIFRALQDYATAATASGKELQLTNPMVIDLTATFGAGNEPTAAQMDALLSAFPNSWFDGTQELLPIKTLYNAKANKVQEAWITPTLLNSWTQADATNMPVRYRKDEFGIVHLFGRLSGGTAGTAAFTLPVGYRPSKRVGFACYTSSGTHGKAYALATGEVYIYEFNSYIQIDSISFFVD